ncbi:zincin-like metallopeptidase domain-containing protein [Sphingobacterium multivorum]|uniref:zincin-like metallopeptidase domain-containing protein n=1 Tax=Sphingobacterium multivorum TaxID=28454 RepID=UPI0026AAD808
MHELAHWTGHNSRLDRSLFNKFGTEAYAREELRAEIASMLIGQELKIGHDPGQHAAYVKSWIQLLTDHPFEIHAAAADAEKILNYLLTFERKLEIKQSNANEIKPEQAIPELKKIGLFIGDEIPYEDNIFKVTGLLKKGRFRMEELNSGRFFALTKNDELYRSLINCKQQLQQTRIKDSKPDLEPVKEDISVPVPKR